MDHGSPARQGPAHSDSPCCRQVLHQNPSSVHYMGFQSRPSVSRVSALPRWASAATDTTAGGGGGGDIPTTTCGFGAGGSGQQPGAPPEPLGLYPGQHGVGPGAGGGCGTTLERLFAFAPDQLQEALSAVAEGRVGVDQRAWPAELRV